MTYDGMIKVIEMWISQLSDKGSSAILIKDSKGTKITDVRIKGYSTGIEIDSSIDTQITNVDIERKTELQLIELLSEFKTTLENKPQDKKGLTDTFDKIYTICGTVNGVVNMVTILSRFLGLS